VFAVTGAGWLIFPALWLHSIFPFFNAMLSQRKYQANL
jgi:hypothetical protein